ncbi:MAG: sigma-70 family RNA polymerase sigma factor [Verrucomicrobia bacterium]|nr:MAG: sigma-70 family RNA polymerase sigma factor [Verrucomicrobiota bacterium]
MPADDEVPSLSAIGGSAQNGAVAFATTHWSVVLAAQDESPAAQEALEKLCRTYWRPIYSFVRRQGRLRSYLLTSLKHFLTNERSRAMAVKRGEGQRLIPLEDLRVRERAGFEPADIASADHVYERRWALTVLDQVLTRLRDEYRATGKMLLFDQLQKSLTDEPERPSQAEIAHELGMTENAVKQAFHRLRQRYRELLREEIAHTVMAPGDIEDELRHLIAVLRA